MTLNEPTDPYASIVASFTGRHVLVLGDAILDEYVLGSSGRISPEAPVPILKVSASRTVLGGAANTAANIVSLGGRATLLGLVGDDEGGRILRQRCADAGVELASVDNGLRTLRKTRVVAQQQQIVRLDYEDVQPAGAAAEAAILRLFEAKLRGCDIVVVSDYAKGLLSKTLARAVITQAHAAGRQVIIDPRPEHRDFYRGCDYLTPNWRESQALLGWAETEPSRGAVVNVARTVSTEFDTNVVLTLGPHGISFCGKSHAEEFAMPTLAREVFDVSGAGDTVVAALALALAAGADHPTAVAIANRAASIAVGKFGTATVTAEEILQDSDAVRLIPRQALAQLAATLRAKGKRIVTTNGSFDILHGGHLHILNEARQCGDVLFVGLNSDTSVKSYKGASRPIVPERRRAEMLLALRMVDYVHVFNEPDPIAFLTEIKPDVHVNGSEYGEDCIERDIVIRGGGRIFIVERLPGLSTTGLIEDLSQPNRAAVHC
jgi:D-beta-D-heptose 7-phosphate kinase/D-beta-D-heptose 1-phosphate adenosyltransferase